MFLLKIWALFAVGFMCSMFIGLLIFHAVMPFTRLKAIKRIDGTKEVFVAYAPLGLNRWINRDSVRQYMWSWVFFWWALLIMCTGKVIGHMFQILFRRLGYLRYETATQVAAELTNYTDEN